MWTLREGKVEPGVSTPDVEPVGVAEHDRISVGGGDRYADQVTALNPTAPQLDIAGGVAVNDCGRRLQPDRLLDRVRQNIGVVAHKRERPGVAEQMPDSVENHALRRVDTAEHQHRRV